MTKRKHWISNRLFPGSRLRWNLFSPLYAVQWGDSMCEFLFPLFVLVCVRGGQNLTLPTVYLNHLCSLIHEWYCMHLVTGLKGVDPNAYRRHGGRWYVMGDSNEYSAKDAEAYRSSGGSGGGWTGELRVRVDCRGRPVKATSNLGLEAGECCVVGGWGWKMEQATSRISVYAETSDGEIVNENSNWWESGETSP